MGTIRQGGNAMRQPNGADNLPFMGIPVFAVTSRNNLA